jgi:hypothetical protein
MMLFMVSVISSIRLFVTTPKAAQLPSSYPLVYVYPYNETCTVGETFTVSVIVYNLTNKVVPDPYSRVATVPLGNLYGFDLQLTWDPTVIHCINHTVTTPFENYSTPMSPSPYAGILHGYGPGNTSLVTVENVVNEAGNISSFVPADVRAWFSYATITPASVFNGNGTICTLTFKVLKKGVSPIQIVSVTLSDVSGDPIGYSSIASIWLNPPRSGSVTVTGAPQPSSPTYLPTVGVVNKPMYFSTFVTGNDTPVAKYMWNFGDGTDVENTTVPTVGHNYTSSSIYTVTVTALDVDGAEGSNSVSGVMVATSRDLEATSITLSQSAIVPDRTLTVMTIASNLGVAGFIFNESCTIRLYYNTSSLGSNTVWVQAGAAKNVTIPSTTGNTKQVSFSLNSSTLPRLEAYYYFEFNVTGIPSGYEANTANNVEVSAALFYTSTIVNQVSIETLAGGYAAGVGVPAPPVISGEDTSVFIIVLNAGDDFNQFNVTLYLNGSIAKNWTTSMLRASGTQSFSWSKSLGAGIYNITAVASGGSAPSAEESKICPVVKTPSLVVDYSPISPVVDQEVTLNASGSTDPNPGGTIVKFLWKIFEPGVSTAGTPNATLSGSVAKFKFGASGNWTVVLTVTSNVDGYNLTYVTRRLSTYAYQKPVVLYVASTSGLSEELVIGIVVVVVVVIIAVSLILRRRRPKPSV